MSKKTSGVVVLLGMCALSLFLANCGSSSSRPSGALYVVSQAENNISSYAVNLDNGNLTLISTNLSVTCSTASCGLPVDLSLDPTGATAFVLNQGVACVPGQTCVDPCGPAPLTQCVSIPPTIYGYNVNSDGGLSAPAAPVIWTHPTSSTDDQDDDDTAVAMVRDAAGQFLFVINKGSVPTQGNSYLSNCPQVPVGSLDACPSISVFSTKPGSTGATLTGNNCPGTNTPCPFRLSRIPTALSVITFTPLGGSAETLLFVASSVDLTANHNDNELSEYLVDSSGNLTEQPNSPYTAQPNPVSVIAVNTNPVGQTTGGIFVYAGSQNGTSPGVLGEFQLCTPSNTACSPGQVADNALLPAGTTTMGSCNDPVAMLVDPTNSYLYVACNVSSNLYGFHMLTGTGALTPINPPSQPTGASPVALAMHPNYNAGAEFLFVSNLEGSSVTGFNVAATTGTLSGSNTVLFPPGEPSGLAGR